MRPSFPKGERMGGTNFYRVAEVMRGSLGTFPRQAKRKHRKAASISAAKYPRRALHGSAKKDRLHHRFNLGSHLLSRNAVGCLVPLARGPEDGPGSRGRQQFGIGTGRRRVMGSTFS